MPVEPRDQGRPVLALLKFVICVVELSSAIPELVDSAAQTRRSREARGGVLEKLRNIVLVREESDEGCFVVGVRDVTIHPHEDAELIASRESSSVMVSSGNACLEPRA